MLDFYFNRRDFLRLGSIGGALGLSGLTLADEEELAPKLVERYLAEEVDAVLLVPV